MSQNGLMTLQNSLPQAIEHEKSLLASCILFNDSCVEITELIKPDDFYLNSHQIIFKAIIDLQNKQNPIELISISEHLKSNNELSQVGGATYLARLLDFPIPSNNENYCQVVCNKSKQRQMILACEEIKRNCYDANGDLSDVLDEASNKIFNIVLGGNSFKIESMKEITVDFMEYYEKIMKGGTIGIKTGFKDIDKMTLGFQNTDFNIIAGRPGSGKTSFMMDLIEKISTDNIHGLCFSLEMSKQQLNMRNISRLTGIDLLKLRSGKITNEEFIKVNEVNSRLYDWPIYIDDSPALTVSQIRQRTRQYVRKFGIKIVFIDYLQLIKVENRAERRDIDIGNISSALKALAKELNIPIVALSQINRKSDDRHDKRPILSDLRESGNLEQDADVVGFIYKPAEAIKKKYDSDGKETEQYSKLKGIAEFILEKQRNGPTGRVKLAWLGRISSFRDLEYLNI